MKLGPSKRAQSFDDSFTMMAESRHSFEITFRACGVEGEDAVEDLFGMLQQALADCILAFQLRIHLGMLLWRLWLRHAETLQRLS